jgi:flagellar protein FlgJ
MDISALQPHVKAADLPIEKLAANPNISDTDKVGQACRQFEAVFLRQILKDARKTVVSSSADHDSTISGIYDDMVTSQLADSISRSGAFGLAKSLQAQLVHQVLPHGDAAKSKVAPPATQPQKLSKP